MAANRFALTQLTALSESAVQEEGIKMKKTAKKLLVLVLIMGITVSMLAGCGSESRGPSSTGNDPQSSTLDPAPNAGTTGGSQLTVAVGSQFTTFDPALNTEIWNAYVTTHMFSGMFRKGPNEEVINNLCESYEVSEDGLTYTFHMVSDAVWSDGVPITAYDFEYSYLRALSYGEDNGYTLALCEMSNIEGADKYREAALLEGKAFDCTTADHSYVGIEAVDDTTLVLRLNTPCGYLTNLMSIFIWIPVREDFAPQHESLWAFDGGYPTSGAYTLTECNEQEKAVLSKNPNYRFADEVTMETIRFLCMPSEDSQAFAYQTGEIDVALGISTESAITYKNEDSEELWIMPQPSNYFLAINSGPTGPDWAKDVRVRRALALAIDKEDLVSVLGGSLFYPVLNGYVPDGIRGEDDFFRAEGDADGYTLTYDPGQARALLAEAGYDESNPLRITYKYTTSIFHGDIATKLQQMWKEVGVIVEPVGASDGAFWTQLDQGDFEIARYGFAFTDSAFQYLNMWTTGMQIVPAVSSPEYDRMIAEAHMITDPSEFNAALHAAEDYLVEENVYLIPLFNFNVPALVHSNVKGYTMAGFAPYFAYTTITE